MYVEEDPPKNLSPSLFSSQSSYSVSNIKMNSKRTVTKM